MKVAEHYDSLSEDEELHEEGSENNNEPSSSSNSNGRKNKMPRMQHYSQREKTTDNIVGTDEYDPNQPLEVKRQVRRTYRNMIQELQDSKMEAVKPDSMIIENILKKSNQLFKSKVKNPSEALLDLRLMNAAAELGAERLAKLPIGSHDLNVSSFLERFMSFFFSKMSESDEANFDNNDGGSNNNNAMEVDGDDGDDAAVAFVKRGGKLKIDWTAFGIEIYGAVARTCPTMSFMYGSLDKEFKERKVAERRKRDSIGPLQKPSMMTHDDIKKQTGEDSSGFVKALFKLICEESSPEINFFKVIVDPSSFGHSVETLFHLSFLIRDGRIGLKESSDGELVVYVTGDDAETGNRMDTNQKQYVLNLTMDTWKKAILKYNITSTFFDHSS